jgi:hydrogenase maturation factor
MYVANEGTFLCVCDEEIADEVLEILQRVNHHATKSVTSPKNTQEK